MEKKDKIISLSLRLLLGASLALSGITKLFIPGEFASVLIYAYHFPYAFGVLVATLLPVCEIVIAVGLFHSNFSMIFLQVTRILMACFALFHLWDLFYLKSKLPCFCFGHLFLLNGQVMFPLTIFLFILACLPKNKIVEVREIGSGWQGFKIIIRKNLFVTVFIMIIGISTTIIRYNRIDYEIRSGLIINNGSFVEGQIKSLLTPLFISENVNRPILFLFLRSPTCNTCLSELQFWSTSPFTERLKIVAIFPPNTDMAEITKIFTLLKIPFNLAELSKSSYTRIMGDYPPFVGRILFSKEGEIIFIRADNGTDIDHIKFERKLKEVLKTS